MDRWLAEATLSAFLIALMMVSVLKGLSSRVHPEALEPVDTFARSTLFNIGFLESGFASIVEGWPSGHAATNGAVCLVTFYLAMDVRLRVAAMVWMIWVVLATVFGTNGDVHWLSDSVAGLVIAWIIGLRIRQESRPELL